MNSNISDALVQIAEMLGTSVEHLLSVYQSTYYLEWVGPAVFGFLFALTAISSIVLGRSYENRGARHDDWREIAAIVCGFCALAMFALSLGTSVGAIKASASPERYAVTQVLEALGKAR